jgi:RNA polymerase sigma factor (TIGR02999 family)
MTVSYRHGRVKAQAAGRTGVRRPTTIPGPSLDDNGAVSLTAPGSVTGLLLAWGAGDDQALEQLIPQVERELRLIAKRCMAGERAGHSLQATALVNEAYLRLVDAQHVKWRDRAHFLAMAARLMRRVLVDRARAKHYQKRGGGALKVTFTEALAATDERAHDLLALDDALVALAAFDERKSKVVELRFFGGLGVDETAAVLEVSPETVMRDWKFARAWLLHEMGGTP